MYGCHVSITGQQYCLWNESSFFTGTLYWDVCWHSAVVWGDQFLPGTSSAEDYAGRGSEKQRVIIFRYLDEISGECYDEKVRILERHG